MFFSWILVYNWFIAYHCLCCDNFVSCVIRIVRSVSWLCNLSFVKLKPMNCSWDFHLVNDCINICWHEFYKLKIEFYKEEEIPQCCGWNLFWCQMKGERCPVIWTMFLILCSVASEDYCTWVSDSTSCCCFLALFAISTPQCFSRWLLHRDRSTMAGISPRRQSGCKRDPSQCMW